MQQIPGSIIAILVAIAIGTLPHLQKKINVYMMGFFRDISRVKARKRRMNSNALANISISIQDIKSIVFDEEEDPLQDVADKIMHENGIDPDDSGTRDLPLYTREELYELGCGNGDNESGVLLLSIFDRVYDVTAGEKYYGPEGKYHLFAGRDVTRSLSTGCLKESCLGSRQSHREGMGIDKTDTDGFELNEKTIREGKKWVAFFETHDVYKHVGFLEGGESIEHMIDSLVEQDIQKETTAES